jgi:hypothetical protein
MARVSVVPRERAVAGKLPSGISGDATTAAYLEGPRAPLHLFIHDFGPGTSLEIGPRPVDCLAYVWTGEIEANGRPLVAGSSLVVEHGASLRLTGTKPGTQVLTFAAADPQLPSRDGGQVHLLPVDRVLRISPMAPGINGAMHFDSACPTCEVWLHESEFTPAFLTPKNETRSAHSHTEDEIIFVTEGQIRLGNRLYGPGTALGIAAHTMYTFNPGPEGVTFINFRAAMPEEIIRADGQRSSEAAGWQRQLEGKRPDYLVPA